MSSHTCGKPNVSFCFFLCCGACFEFKNVTKMIECLPIDDSQKHDTGGMCTCCPNIIFENGEMIVIHMAFDGRHLVEEVNEILNNPQPANRWTVIKS